MEYTFNGFELDEISRVLRKGDRRFKLEPKVFELLLYFCQQPNQAISRDTLISEVWSNRIVSYAAINRAISELRKVIEEEVTKPKVIITVSKIGYLFDAQVVLNNKRTSSDKSKLTEVSLDRHIQQSTMLVSKDIDLSKKIIDRVKAQASRDKITKKLFILMFIMIGMVVWYVFFYPLGNMQAAPMKLSIEKPITTLKGTSFKGDLSATGKDLVFLHKDKAHDLVQVWLKIEGQAAEKLTFDAFYYTYVIFAGTEYVLASRFTNLDERQCEIVKISLKNKSINKVFDCAQRAITNLSYAESTNTAYFNYRRSITNAFNIYSYQLDSNSLQQITFSDLTAEHGDFNLALSPSRSKLAVLEYRENHRAVLKFISLKSLGNEVELGPMISADSRISWLNEDQLLFADGEQLHAYDLLNQTTRVLRTNTNIGFAKAHAATNKIIYDKGEVIANIYQYPLERLETVTREAVTNSSFINYKMEFANLSKTIAYLSTDSGVKGVMIKREGEYPFNTHFPDKIRIISNLHWSSNDDFLLAGINKHIYLYDIRTQVWRLVQEKEDNIHFVHFIDVNNIAFSSKRSGQWQIWKMNLQTYALTQLTTKGGYSVQFSTNKQVAYLTKYNSEGVFKLNLSTKEESVLLPHHKVTAWRKWQVRGEKLYYIRKQELRQLDLGNQSNVLITTFEEKAPTSFSVSFDHSSVQRELVDVSSANIWLTKVE